ncbi:hypothetical protein ASE85_04275 [Sphingobium sp. Leaf26]|nr:hypothetical protein ASE85_04275 [Sphingobium sp. Leaf26]
MASKLVKLGNGTVLSTDNYTYGYFGEILSITSLQSGLDTKKYYVYDTDGKITHEIWPDPDATGPLSRKIVKYVYDADGRKVETQDGYGSMTDGTDFVWQQKVRLTYDSSTGQLAKRETVTP